MTALFRTLALALVAVGLAAIGARADDDMVAQKSAHDVPTTIDRLQAIVGDKGITVMARFDHAAGAAKVDMALRPTQVLVFGNPSLGTPLMQQNQRIGLDLPLRVVAWQAEDGETWIGYLDPEEMAERYGIAENDPVIQKMKDALAAFTEAAAAP